MHVFTRLKFENTSTFPYVLLGAKAYWPLTQGTLLAFAENRINGCGDQGTHNLVVRRSTDMGRTWGELITVFKGVIPCPGCPAAVSNPNPVEVTLPNSTRAVLLAFDTMNNPSASHHGLDMTTWSFDDGLTWGRVSTMAYPPQKNVILLRFYSMNAETPKLLVNVIAQANQNLAYTGRISHRPNRWPARRGWV